MTRKYDYNRSSTIIKKYVLMVMVLLMTLYLFAQSRTLYVDGDRPYEGNGTIGNEYKHIQIAIDSIISLPPPANDTIYIQIAPVDQAPYYYEENYRYFSMVILRYYEVTMTGHPKQNISLMRL